MTNYSHASDCPKRMFKLSSPHHNSVKCNCPLGALEEAQREIAVEKHALNMLQHDYAERERIHNYDLNNFSEQLADARASARSHVATLETQLTIMDAELAKEREKVVVAEKMAVLLVDALTFVPVEYKLHGACSTLSDDILAELAEWEALAKIGAAE